MALPPLATVEDLSAWIGRSLIETGDASLARKTIRAHMDTAAANLVA